MAKRKYEIVAEQYLTEWLSLNYPPGSWRTNVNIGVPELYGKTDISQAEYKYIKRSFSAKADAVVFLPSEVHIVEAKIRDDRGKIEQLLIYEWLFKKDPEFKAYWDYPITKILLTPKDMGLLEKFLAELGIKVVYYKPAWLMQYYYKIRAFERRGLLSSVKF